jgi:hypothetical protein
MDLIQDFIITFGIYENDDVFWEANAALGFFFTQNKRHSSLKLIEYIDAIQIR